MFREILVPTDFSDGSLRAVRLAIKLARESKGRITFLHVGVIPTPIGLELYGGLSTEILASARDQMHLEQRHAAEKLAREELPEGMEFRIVIREGYPPDEILAESAQNGIDLIVLATHGRTGLDRVLLGSVAERVIRGSMIPVLVTR